MFREILPNLMAPIIVYATLIIPINILFEAALSFLGVGVQPPTASWGAMIADATGIFDVAWWYMVFPGLALAFDGPGLQSARRRPPGRFEPACREITASRGELCTTCAHESTEER